MFPSNMSNYVVWGIKFYLKQNNKKLKVVLQGGINKYSQYFIKIY